MLFYLGSAGSALAATVLTSEVTENGGKYHMAFDAVVEAPYDRVHALLTDYPGLPRYNPHIKEIVLIPDLHSRTLRMRVVSRPCVVVFCKTVVHVQEVEERSPGDIVAEVIPALSDLKHGYMHWRIIPQGRETRVTFEGDMTPAFWVPPLIGPALVKYALRTEALELVTNLEQAAGR
jgi:hypothetical protein